jgi:NACHT domain
VTGPEVGRVAAVFGERQGSGYLLDAKEVLTAAHVVGTRHRPEVIVPGGRGRVACTVLWQNAKLDAAVLLADRALVGHDTARWLAPLTCSEIIGMETVGNCKAIGFPHVQRHEANHLDTEQFVGTLKPGSAVMRGHYVFDLDHAPPAARGGGGSPWAGMSGAAMFAHGHFIGLVTQDPQGWQHSRLVAVPALKLIDHPRFPTGYVLMTRSIVTDPVTAFERDYTAFVAKKYGDLTIFGLDLSNRSRAAWPLDSAYLSLEARSGNEWRPDTASLPGQPPVPAQTVRRADEALAGQSRVLLRGVAGSGKTTLVQWLAVSAAKQDHETCMPHLLGKIPFVLPLRTVIRRGELPSPGDFLASTGNPLKGRQPEGWAESVLHAGRGLLLIDGMDEIPERERERTRAWLRDLLLAFPDNLWLVTSRPSAVTEGWLDDEGFTDFTLSPMTRAEVTTFVERWHNAARETAGGDSEELARLDDFQGRLLDALHTKQDLARLATNPLMCGLICALHRDRRAHLPRGRKDLYDAALSMLLARRDEERDMGNPDGIELSEEAQKQLLQRLAYWLIRNGQVELEQELARDLIADALPSIPAAAAQGDAGAILRHLLVRSGLLREPTLDTVDFVHRTFQDYLGARAAVEARDFDLMVRNAHDDQWEDVIRMAVAHARPDERARLLRKLVQRGDKVKSRRTRLHVLAMACLEHATELDPEVRELVEARATELIPPRNDDDAEALAAAGRVVLELLPGPEHLSDEEARAVVATAVTVGTDAAIPVLARFREHRGSVGRLMTAWPAFDTERYAREIIEHLPHEGTIFEVSSREELRALRGMGGRPWTRLDGPFTEEELIDGLSPESLTTLHLWNNPALGDLRFAQGFPHLRQLALAGCDSITDLSPLRDSRVRYLTLHATALTGLRGLTMLSTLGLFQPLEQDLSSTLPRDAELVELHFGLGSLPPTGLRGLAQWEAINTLILYGGPDELAPADWTEMARLPNLRALTIDHEAVGTAEDTALAGVEKLSLINADERLDLDRLPRLFPNVREFVVSWPGKRTVNPESFRGVFPDAELTTRAL